MVRKLVLAVAAASAMMSSNGVFALGMGDIDLRSSLNQPLDAEIELLQIRDLSSQEILPALATPDEFGRAGIERVFFLNDLTFTPVVRPDGKAVIRITSTRPVREPFLNFLVEVRWPSGRVLREFTLLLDPPLYDPGPVVATAPVSQATRQPSAVQPAPTPQVQPPQQPIASSASRAAPAEPLYQQPDTRAPVAQAPATRSGGEIRTSQADTLWEIALRHRPQGASVHQTMLAIQDLNPEAFIGGNINRLRAGQTLSLPDASQATSRSQAEAINQVAAQNSSWQQGRQPAEPTQRQLDARQRDQAAAAPQTTRNGDALRLVGSGDEQEEGGADAGSRNGEGQLRDQLDTTKEELDSVRREKAEAESRLADMQSQMETLQRLLELKDEQLAAMQQSLGDSAELPEAATVPAEELTEDEIKTLTAADQEPVLSEPALSEAEMPAAIDPTEPLETDALAEEPAVASEQSGVVEPQTDTAQVADEPDTLAAADTQASGDQDTLGLLQRMMQNQTLLLAGGGLILLLLLLVLMAVARRNARRETDMTDNFIARAAQDNETPEESDEFNIALAGYQDEREQGLDIAQDPLVEADALIAYGKLDQAADVLNSAIEREPERTDLRLKLMEVRGLQDDAEGYAEQESVLRQDGTVDQQVDMLNVRFPAMAAALASAAVSADAYPELDEDFLQERREESADESSEESVKTDSPVEEYDFSGFDAESEPAARQEPLAEENLEDFDLDFDLDDSLAQSLAQSDTAAPAVENKDDDFEFDFDLDEPLAEVPPTRQPSGEEFNLDEDFDLSLTDDLETPKPDESEPRAALETELEPLEVEQTVELSDRDLEGFEAELDASTAETEAHAEADRIEEAEAEPVPAQPDLTDEDEDEDEFDFLSGTDESATKLDLARAYIDMGDQEGARDILSEVIEEGNEQQQQEARDMMGQLD